MSEVNTLGDALPKEIARVRDEVLPEYVAVGPGGMFAASLMRRDIRDAELAISMGDTVEMIRVYERLKKWEL